MFFRYGRGKIFDCRAIKSAYDACVNLGYQEILIIVPQWRRNRPRRNKPITDKHILEDMHRKGVLEFTPCRRVGGINMNSYDDRLERNCIL